MKEVRCYSVSLGCPKNRVDTEHFFGSLGIHPLPVDTPDQADLVFVNTCAFIAPAVEESVQAIAQILADLEGEKTRPVIAVAGCLVGRYGVADLAAELPEVDVWLDNREIESWPHKVSAALKIKEDPAGGRFVTPGSSYAWLKISDGCNHRCSFCTIPSIRGIHRSFSRESLVREAKGLLQQNVKELVLVAQDVTAWGADIGEKQGLRALLDDLMPLDGLERLRLLYLYPAGLTEDFLAYLQTLGNPFVPYFDIPLQHVNSDILSRMGRPFARDPRKTIERIRKYFPGGALRTSLIVGFPGETDEAFQELLDFTGEAEFCNLGVFEYQAEEGTPAALMPNQVDPAVSRMRREAVMAVQRENSAAWLHALIGTRAEVLVDAVHEEWPGLHVGRTWFQAPEIDGVTYISGDGVAPGRTVTADIVDAGDYDLTALA